MRFLVEEMASAIRGQCHVVRVDFSSDDLASAVRIAEAKAPYVAAAAPNGRRRSPEVQLRRLVAGKLADHAVLNWLRHYANHRELEYDILEYDEVRDDEFRNPDLWDAELINRKTGECRLVEIRSSFVHFIKDPASLLDNVNQSVLGWYVTQNKSHEPRRDFYWQVAFFMRPLDVPVESARKGIPVFRGQLGEDQVFAYIMAGATRDDLKSPTAQDVTNRADGAVYRSISPMAAARSIDIMTPLVFSF
jgi:hypothetical protein